MEQITTKQAALILDVDKRTLFRWADKKIIKCRRAFPLNIRIFYKEDLLHFKESLPKKRERSTHLLKGITKNGNKAESILP
jgi:DNA-binding transcriptional MerR regulator